MVFPLCVPRWRHTTIITNTTQPQDTRSQSYQRAVRDRLPSRTLNSQLLSWKRLAALFMRVNGIIRWPWDYYIESYHGLMFIFSTAAFCMYFFVLPSIRNVDKKERGWGTPVSLRSTSRGGFLLPKTSPYWNHGIVQIVHPRLFSCYLETLFTFAMMESLVVRVESEDGCEISTQILIRVEVAK